MKSEVKGIKRARNFAQVETIKIQLYSLTSFVRCDQHLKDSARVSFQSSRVLQGKPKETIKENVETLFPSPPFRYLLPSLSLLSNRQFPLTLPSLTLDPKLPTSLPNPHRMSFFPPILFLSFPRFGPLQIHFLQNRNRFWIIQHP